MAWFMRCAAPALLALTFSFPRAQAASPDAAAEFIRAKDDKPFFLYYATADPHRGGGEDATVPERPNLFGNKPGRKAFPGINEVFYKPEAMEVPPFLPDTPTCRASPTPCA